MIIQCLLDSGNLVQFDTENENDIKEWGSTLPQIKNCFLMEDGDEIIGHEIWIHEADYHMSQMNFSKEELMRFIRSVLGSYVDDAMRGISIPKFALPFIKKLVYMIG